MRDMGYFKNEKEFETKEKTPTKEKDKKWDGRSRISTKIYKKNYNHIFKKKNEREVK